MRVTTRQGPAFDCPRCRVVIVNVIYKSNQFCSVWFFIYRSSFCVTHSEDNIAKAIMKEVKKTQQATVQEKTSKFYNLIIFLFIVRSLS